MWQRSSLPRSSLPLGSFPFSLLLVGRADSPYVGALPIPQFKYYIRKQQHVILFKEAYLISKIQIRIVILGH